MPAALTLAFDPGVGFAGVRVRWEALALAVVLMVGLALWVRALGVVAGGPRHGSMSPSCCSRPSSARWWVVERSTCWTSGRPMPPSPPRSTWAGERLPRRCRHRGMAAGVLACRLAGVAAGAWADAAAIPLLVTVGAGKLALLLGGAGQGARWDGPWAVAFLGAGPWRSVDAAMAAWPSQALEGVWVLLGILPVWLVRGRLAGGPHAASGILLLTAVAWWLAGRAMVSVTWRDAPAVGPLGPEGIVTVAALAIVGAAAALLVRARRRHGMVR
ncbi:MAG: hypothetical protein R3C32_12485 [Chloroflexota bacterium]